MEVLYIFGGLFLLLIGGDYLVKGASGLALKLNISPMLVGLSVVSLGTSAPELLVSLNAALKGKPDIAMGNVVGSNIANIGLILGATALIFPIAIQKRTLQFDWVVMVIASLLVFLLGMDGILGLLEGIALLAVLVAYIVYSYLKESRGREIPKPLDDTTISDKEKPLIVLLLLLVGGSAALVFGADWLVEGAETLARQFGVSDRVIAITLVAFGTSLPELAASVIAAFKGQRDMSLGNIIGSNIYNLLAIIGITSCILPLEVSLKIMHVDIWWMLATSFVILPLGVMRMRIGRISGIILLTTYIVYILMVVSAG